MRRLMEIDASWPRVFRVCTGFGRKVRSWREETVASFGFVLATGLRCRRLEPGFSWRRDCFFHRATRRNPQFHRFRSFPLFASFCLRGKRTNSPSSNFHRIIQGVVHTPSRAPVRSIKFSNGRGSCGDTSSTS